MRQVAPHFHTVMLGPIITARAHQRRPWILKARAARNATEAEINKHQVSNTFPNVRAVAGRNAPRPALCRRVPTNKQVVDFQVAMIKAQGRL